MLTTDNLDDVHFIEKVDFSSSVLVLSISYSQLSIGVVAPTKVPFVGSLNEAMHSSSEDVGNMLDSHRLELDRIVFLFSPLQNSSAAGEILAVTSNVSCLSHQKQSVIRSGHYLFEMLTLFLVFKTQVVDGKQHRFLCQFA